MPRVRVRLLDRTSEKCIATVDWQIDGHPAEQIESHLIRLFDSDLIGRDRLVDLLRTNPEWPNLQRQRDATLTTYVQPRTTSPRPQPVGVSGSQAHQCLLEVRAVLNKINASSPLGAMVEQPAKYREAMQAIKERLDSAAHDLDSAAHEMAQRTSDIQAALARAGKSSTDWQTHLLQIDALRAEREQALAEQKRLEGQLSLWRAQYDNLRDQLDKIQNLFRECDDERRRLEQQLETARHENERWQEVQQGSADDTPAVRRGPI